MLTRVILAASAAALAIMAPAYADPGGHGGGHGQDGGGGSAPHGGGGGPPASAGGGGHGEGGPHGGGARAFAGHGGGGGGEPHGGEAPMFAGGGGGRHGGEGGPHDGGAPAFGGGGHWRGGGGPQFGAYGGGHHGGGAPAIMNGGGREHGRQGGFAGPQMRSARQEMRGFERFHGANGGHQQYRMAGRQQGRGFGGYERGHGPGPQQSRAFAGRHGGGFERQRGQAYAQRQGRDFARQQGQAFAGPPSHGFLGPQGSHRFAQQMGGVSSQQYGGNWMAPGPQQQGDQQFAIQQLGGRHEPFQGQNFNGGGYPGAGYAQPWGASPYAGLTYGNNVQVLPMEQVQTFIGAPVSQVASIAPLSPIPPQMAYLYPATPGYYYEWGDGYLYQIDRSDNLIAALVPLIAGGYLPGQYLPANYMASYVPDYYGFDSFYPDYGDRCNRYYDGVIYQVDCGDGYVENVVPMYAGGYGVGQLLPATYGYYNVPVQYRSLYYDTADARYWYSPGAIYQYDPHTSVITAVAALMAPGFTVGQPLPTGYDVYNIPLAYRATYYDTPSAWYRYNNGYIYQVDPLTQIVTAIVASLLT